MKTSTLLLTLTAVLSASNAFAVPTIYPTSATYLSSIKNSTNSNLVADDADMRVIFVMPPNSASSTVSGLHTINANVGFCKEMGNLQKYSEEMAEKIKSLRMQQANTLGEMEQLNTKLSKARDEMAETAALEKLTEIVDLDNRLADIDTQLADLNDRLSSCEQNCQVLRSQVLDLRTEKLQVTTKRRQLASTRTKELAAYEKKKAAVAAIETEISDKNEVWQRLNSKLTGAKNDFIAMYTSFGAMEGARAGIQFKSNWDENIDTLRRENPSFDFKKIHTQNAVITTNIADISSLPSGGAILSYEIGGIRKDGTLTMPSYPENMSGNVRLSLLGACPVLHPEYFDIKVPSTTDAMKYGMTVSYEYPSSFKTEAIATYNMYKMYQKIVKSGSKGGFFSSRSWSSVEERNYFKDSYSVEWKDQDAGNALTDEQKADMERDMKNDVYARLATIGLSGTQNAGMLVAPPALSKTGAVVISESLKKTCPGNVYCMGAAITMDVLQSIFGSSSSTASYTNIEDKTLTQRWSRSQVVYKPWVSSYN